MNDTRSFEYLAQVTFLYLYKGLIRPKLAYAQAVWNPYLQGNIYAIEADQRRATKLIPGFSNLEYTERLKKLNMTTILFRRARGDMLETFKYLNGQYNSAPILHLDTRTHGTTSCGYNSWSSTETREKSIKTRCSQTFLHTASCEFVERSSCECGFGPHSECISEPVI